MKKKVLSLLCALLVCLTMTVSAFAWVDTPLLVDQADLLSESEESALLTQLQQISAAQKMDIVVVTQNSLNGKSPRDFADDFYDQGSYAQSGILLLISMEESDWYISTTGYGITAVTDAGLEYMADQFVYQLSEGNYYDAFVRYGELCDDFITQARSGQPYDVGNLPKAPFGFVKNLLITFAVGLVAALIITGRMKNKLKSVHMQQEAKDYVKTGSMHITQSNDLFLYAHVDRVAKPTESRSGGSSTHVSSSGTTHGGGGGKF